MPYTRIKRLGAGHFGEVWLELDEALARFCATKYLDPSRLTPGVDAYAEAQTMVTAQHENVVTVYSADLVGAGPAIRMEYLSEGSVEDKFKGEPLPVAEAVRLLEHTCRGIEHLHIEGLLHRDIKPANLLLTTDNNVKVSDFGLSCKIVDAASATSLAYLSHLPPEAIAAGTGITDEPGDVYAAGVTAYRLINGDALLSKALPSGTNVRSLILHGQYPDRKQWLSHVHKKLQTAVLKAMAPDPTKRFSSAADFRRALEQARPRVSWVVDAGSSHQWSGTGNDGVGWQASIVERSRGGFKFSVQRRLNGKEWRQIGADARSGSSSEALLAHAGQVLQRIATHNA